MLFYILCLYLCISLFLNGLDCYCKNSAPTIRANSCRKYKQLLSGKIPYYKKVTKQGLQTPSLVNIIIKHHHPARQGVPPPAKRLSCGRQCYGLPVRYGHGSCLSVAYAPLTPLRAVVPCACSHRLGGSTSCLSRQPHKPKLLPFAATVAHGRCPRKRTPLALTEVRALTTTFRSDGQTIAP